MRCSPNRRGRVWLWYRDRGVVIRASLLVAGVLLAGSALAQDAADPRLTSHRQSSDPPLPSYFMARIPAVGATAADPDRGGRAQAYAMLGREDRIVAETQQKAPCTLSSANPVEAVAALARDAQVVMVNEAHDSPHHRAFIADMTKALAPLGYRTYAAETFFDNVSQSTQPFPRLTDGEYSNEAAFGDLLRTLRQLQMRLVSYEYIAKPDQNFADLVNEREIGQSSNLINRTVRDRLDERLIVHVGYSHNVEDVQQFGRKKIRWLALRFREITGIDPLTIDQTTFVSDRTGVCATRSDGAALPTDRDIHVAHPPLAFERGRPTWRLARGQRFAEIPRALKRADERVIYEARYASEPDDAVPADRILVDPGEDIPLLLTPGRYRVRAWTQDGAWTESVALTVADPAVRAPQKAQPKARPKSSRRKKR
jgi:hypothetical protein